MKPARKRSSSADLRAKLAEWKADAIKRISALRDMVDHNPIMAPIFTAELVRWQLELEAQ